MKNNKIITREINIVLFFIFEFNNKRKVYKQYDIQRISENGCNKIENKVTIIKIEWFILLSFS